MENNMNMEKKVGDLTKSELLEVLVELLANLATKDDLDFTINRVSALEEEIKQIRGQLKSNEQKVEEVVSDDYNGSFLLSTFLSEEVLAYILVHLNWEDMLSCRLVCHTWKRLIDDVVCFKKIKPRSKEIFSEPVHITPCSLPFYVNFAILRRFIGSNLLKNAFGSDRPRYKHWSFKQSTHGPLGGKAWKVEAEPAGCNPLPEHLAARSCFVTSYFTCAKEQLITLSPCGLNDKIMDEIQPDIEVSEWIARRFDCGIEYKLEVKLLNDKKQAIHQFHTVQGTDLEDTDWHKVTHTIKDYGAGIRYLLFRHEGRDTRFWAGHYGCKMAGGSVVVKLPAWFIDKAHGSS